MDKMIIHTVFEHVVEKYPGRIAVWEGDRSLTYGELNACANRVAHVLAESGIGKQGVVGIYLDASVEHLVSILGVMKAGGVFMPLSTRFPDDWLASILEKTSPEILIVGTPLEKEIPTKLNKLSLGVRPHSMLAIDDACNFRITHLSDESAAPRDRLFSDKNLPLNAGPDDGCYIITTSGSTGRPKAILGCQKGLSHFIHWEVDEFGLNKSDRVSQLSPVTFDVSLRDIFVPLITGGTVCIPDEESRRNPLKLYEWISKAHITLMHIVPTLFRLLTQEIEDLGSREISLSDLRYVLIAGEPLYGSDVINWRRANGNRAELVNIYGPSETTLAKLFFRLEDHDVIPSEIVPIGQPIPDTEVLIIENGKLCAPGETGEIYIKTAFMSKGYYNDSTLNEMTFVQNPLERDCKDIVYKTGDLGQFLPDGNVRFEGRRDGQIKLYGQRVEIGEVESVLRQHPHVLQAASAAMQDDFGNIRLVGYVVPKPGEKPSVESLRRFLGDKLPDYMVPGVYVTLKAMPLTHNGKIDRRALPEPEHIRPEMEQDYVPPSTSLERALSDIWCQVLGLDRVGVYDNFFDLGGHSLLATQVISRVRKAFKVELPLRSVFEAPTVTGLSTCIDTARRSRQGLQAPPLQTTSRDIELPLSFAQQRLWFLSHLDPGSVTYNIPAGIRLRGDLRIDLLERSLSEIVRRHEVLRTVFREVDGRPVQVIQPAFEFDLQVIELQDASDTERRERAQRLASEEARRPFDLFTGPLLRAILLRLDQQDHILVLTMHHIISDGWSLDIITHELETLYRAFLEGRPSPLPKLPVQYADFAKWQREWLKGEVLDSHLTYWREKLSEGLQTLQLRTDRFRPAVQTHNGSDEYFKLPRELVERLKNFSQHQEVTLFMTLLAAFKVLLFRYTGQTDFAVGTPVANRNRDEIEGVIGFFVNTLVLHTDLSGDPRFVDFIRKVRETTLGAYDHQDLPFEKLVEVLNPVRDTSHSPLFQVMIAFWNMKNADIEIPGLSLSPEAIDVKTSKFDLTLHSWADNGELSGRIEYNTDLFDRKTIQRMIGHFEVLLGSITNAPHQRLSELPLLTEKEERLILTEWNSTRRDYPTDKTLVHMFEEQVLRSPAAVAVSFRTNQLTYQELNERSNQLAHYLIKLGVGPEAMVGLFAERSLEMVIAIYGIIKAGGAYVPLDSDYPADRVAFMMADTKVQVLLTQQHLSLRLPNHQATVICLDSDWGQMAGESTENPHGGATPENSAYVIFTSGSTGRPKGVVNEHRGIVNRLIWMQEEYGLTPADRVLQKTPFSFDVSVWEFFWPLQTGARLVMAKPGGHRDPSYLVETIKQEGITTLHFVPSMLQVFLEEPQAGSCTCIRRVICSGEALSCELQRRFFERLGAELHNLYGPTEAAVDVTYWACQRNSERLVVPIGRPVANTQMYILDSRMQPVPVGVTGELYIGGVQVARGYLNRAELTAERFVQDRFSGVPGAKLYRTGDLARYLPDGVIEYLGRLDFQVKIRGMRVELGEIETRLEQYENVGRCAVLLRADIPGDQQLVAYYVPRNYTELNIAALRGWLKQTLPDFMVPQHFFRIEKMPLTASGKVDRRALPKPPLTPSSETRYMASRNHTEQVIADVWKELLGLERVGVHDNFFDLGGHSLLVIRMVGLLKNHFAKPIGVVDIFEHPTVERLGAFFAMTMREGDTISRAQALSQGSKQRAALQKARQRYDRDLGRKKIV